MKIFHFIGIGMLMSALGTLSFACAMVLYYWMTGDGLEVMAGSLSAFVGSFMVFAGCILISAIFDNDEEEDVRQELINMFGEENIKQVEIDMDELIRKHNQLNPERN